jgi:hypothetical protein
MTYSKFDHKSLRWNVYKIWRFTGLIGCGLCCNVVVSILRGQVKMIDVEYKH